MLSELSLVFFALWLGVVALFVYSAFWAFSIRRILVAGLYRRQAFWLGAMGVYFVSLSTFLSIALTLELSSLYVNILGAVIISAGFTLIFLWIDLTVRIARRSDPLFRDTLRWSKLRFLFWFVTIGGAIGAFFTSIGSGFAEATPFGGVLFFGAVALYKSARRSGDRTFRKHLSWTALCIFLLWLGSQIQEPLSHFVSDPYLTQSLTWPLVLAGAYSLYRSARSLVPMGHLKSLETNPTIGLQPSATAS
ncbi:hypothetical protein J2P12_02150 [Candidatus Bathyarchaeota archaeon]|nr:hypothetical protein [Candidatus Bathyarchaeota archaeon]